MPDNKLERDVAASAGVIAGGLEALYPHPLPRGSALTGMHGDVAMRDHDATPSVDDDDFHNGKHDDDNSTVI